MSQTLDLSTGTPSIELRAQEWIVLSTIQIPDSQAYSMTLSWLQIHIDQILSDVTDACSSGGKNSISADTPNGSVANAVWLKDFLPDTAPMLQTYYDILLAPADFNVASDAVAPIHSNKITDPVTITDPGTYSLVLANNTLNRKIWVSVNGVIQINYAV
jgi:hypothetical protein